jgi:hypothetical protein
LVTAVISFLYLNFFLLAIAYVFVFLAGQGANMEKLKGKEFVIGSPGD